MAETGVLASVRAFDRKKRKNSVYFLLTFEDIPGLGSVESVHVGDRHGGVRQGAAFVEVATVYARDQRRLHVVPVGARDPVAAVGGGATRGDLELFAAGQVWSLSSFDVGHQLLRNDLN